MQRAGCRKMSRDEVRLWVLWVISAIEWVKWKRHIC